VSLAAALEASPTAERAKVDREAGALVGSRCRNCATVSFPARAVCHRCGAAEMEPAPLATRGELVTHTTVHIPRPGVEAPFTLGQVELGEGVLVFGHIRGLRPGDKVPLAVEMKLAPDDESVPPYWFEPVRR
jgi:uncharacterized OB-fold protein